jgi:hypothetical protein
MMMEKEEMGPASHGWEGGAGGCADWQDPSYTVASIIDDLPIEGKHKEEKVNLLGVRIS